LLRESCGTSFSIRSSVAFLLVRSNELQQQSALASATGEAIVAEYR
jgi:hypothetical protein